MLHLRRSHRFCPRERRSTKRKRRLADAAERPASTAASSQQAAPSERTANGGAVEPRLIAALADPEAGRQRTHEELVQLMGNDAPRAPNRKKRRVELQVLVQCTSTAAVSIDCNNVRRGSCGLAGPSTWSLESGEPQIEA